MTALDHNPNTISFLSPLGFKFQIKKCPNVNFFIQSINVPSISLPELNVSNPFIQVPYGGDHISYGDMNLSFKVDENLTNYMEIYNWVKGIGFPDTFKEFQNLANKPKFTGEGLVSDISLLILSSSRNPTYEVLYKDAFPVSLSEIQFNTTSTDVQYLTATAYFKYTSYDILKV